MLFTNISLFFFKEINTLFSISVQNQVIMNQRYKSYLVRLLSVQFSLFYLEKNHKLKNKKEFQRLYVIFKVGQDLALYLSFTLGGLILLQVNLESISSLKHILKTQKVTLSWGMFSLIRFKISIFSGSKYGPLMLPLFHCHHIFSLPPYVAVTA